MVKFEHPNTFFCTLASVSNYSTKLIDVVLEYLLPDHLCCNAVYSYVHIEATCPDADLQHKGGPLHPRRALQLQWIHQCTIHCRIKIFASPPDKFLSLKHFCLNMTVNPHKGELSIFIKYQIKILYKNKSERHTQDIYSTIKTSPCVCVLNEHVSKICTCLIFLIS